MYMLLTLPLSLPPSLSPSPSPLPPCPSPSPLPLSLLRNCVYAVRHGLFILAGLLKDCDIQHRMVGWGIPDLLQDVKTKFPDFATKKDVCHCIVDCSPECAHMKEMLDRDDFDSG